MTTVKNVLLVNAISSGATGLGLLIFAPWVADIFEVSQPEPFYGTGIFLLAFAGLVIYEALKKSINARGVYFISVLDITWVVASMAIVLLGLFQLSLIGYILITGVAAWVACMAFLQLKGIKHLPA